MPLEENLKDDRFFGKLEQTLKKIINDERNELIRQQQSQEEERRRQERILREKHWEASAKHGKEQATISELKEFYRQKAGFSLALDGIFSCNYLFGVKLNLSNRAGNNPNGASANTLRYFENPKKQLQDEETIKKLKQFYEKKAGISFAARGIFNTGGSLMWVKLNLMERARKNPEGTSAQTLNYLSTI